MAKKAGSGQDRLEISLPTEGYVKAFLEILDIGIGGKKVVLLGSDAVT